MNRNHKILSGLLAAAAIFAWLAVSLRNSGPDGQKSGAEAESGTAADYSSPRSPGFRPADAAAGRPRPTAARPETDVDDGESERYGHVDDEERKKLTEEQCETLEGIRRAHDDEDREALVKIVRKMQSVKGWNTSVPLVIRSEAMDALGWFGVPCLPEIAGFLADPDKNVLDAAVEQFDDAVEDSELSDAARADIMVMASQVIIDPDAMDSMLFELNNINRNVAVEAIKKMWASANKTTKELLADAVESFTGEEGIDTPDKLDDWLSQNPDEE